MSLLLIKQTPQAICLRRVLTKLQPPYPYAVLDLQLRTVLKQRSVPQQRQPPLFFLLIFTRNQQQHAACGRQ